MRTNVLSLFIIESVQKILEQHEEYLHINYWEKDTKVIKFDGMYLVLLNSLQTEEQNVNFLIKLLEI